MDTFTDATWEREVLASPIPVVIGFCASWCIPSRMARPALESAEQHHAGRLRFGIVDGDESGTAFTLPCCSAMLKWSLLL